MGRSAKIHIWVITKEYHPKIIGGLGVVATQLSRALRHADVDVTVFCSNKSDQPAHIAKRSGLRVIWIPRHARTYTPSAHAFKMNAVLRAASGAAARAPDLIHVHSIEFADAAIAAASQYRIPILYTCHSLVSSGGQSIQGKNQMKLFRAASRIVTPSLWLAGEIGRLYAGASGKVTVIPHGVKHGAQAASVAPTNLLYVGRLVQSKGVEPLIQAFAQLAASRPVQLTIVGSGPPAYVRKLHVVARKLNVANRITWIQRSSNESVQRMYASYGAVIVPSKRESFCLVALEAMAHGVPLVSTLSGGLKEFVNANNASIIQAINGAAIARAIKAMLNNPARTRKRVINARHIAARYQWPAVALRYKALLQELIKGGAT